MCEGLSFCVTELFPPLELARASSKMTLGYAVWCEDSQPECCAFGLA